MASTYSEYLQGLTEISADRRARQAAAAAATTPFVLLHPADPLPTGLPEGTIVIRAAAVAPAPQALALTGFINDTVDANPATVDISSIPNGSWMLAVSSTLNTSGATIITPDGWTVLVPETIAGTTRMVAFAKVKTSADALLTINQGQTLLHATSVLHGVGAAPIGNWIVSPTADRTTATSTTTVAPGLANVPAGSLTFAFAGERTNADELTEPTATAPKVTYLHGDASVGIETLYVAQPEDPTAATTFTYPNAQTSNGIAFTVAVTP